MDNQPNLPEEIENEEVEKGSAFRPVFLTLFVLAVIGGLIYLPFYAEQDPLLGILNSDQWWVPNVGEYHPLILHLPIGIVFLTLAMEVCSWFTFGKYRPRTAVGLFFGFITGAFACVTGLFDLSVEGWKAESWDDDMFKHMWVGIGFVGVLGLAFIAKIWGSRSGSRGPVYGVLLLLAGGAMGYGSHFGGLATHKSDPVENTWEGLTENVEFFKQWAIEVDSTKEEVRKETKDQLIFAEVVYPILDDKCLYCHSEEAGKDKGGLLMDSYENLLIGGDSQDGDDYRTLVPGDSQKSYMIEVMILPKDDDMHMPPPKKKQMEEHEVKLLTWWVNNIPASDTLEDKTLEEMGAPADIIEAAAMLVSPEERKSLEEAAEAAKAKAEQEKVAKREALQNSIDALKLDPAFKTSLNYASQDSTDLEFTAVSLRGKLDDATFLKLAPVSTALTSVKLGATSVTEATIAAELPKMANLRKLDLSQTQIGDAALDAVAQLEGLEWLNLYGTQVSDAGLIKLKGLGNLKKIYLWQSKATHEGAKVLQAELPGLEVVFGVN
ncbi:MAG: c-type cytochrome domain-containing protein [Akkermansiaceae bacterium]